MKFFKKNKKESKDQVNETLPVEIDFSTAAIKKAVRSEINQHPITIYSGLATIASIFYMTLFGPNSILLGLSLSGFLISGGSFIFNKFFRNEIFEMKHVGYLREMLHKNTELAIKKIKKDLKIFNCMEGSKQIDKLKDKYDSLVSVLHKKLNPGNSIVFHAADSCLLVKRYIHIHLLQTLPAAPGRVLHHQ